MRLHPMVIYTFGAVTIWLMLVTTSLVALAWESYAAPAFMGGSLALLITLSMRFIEWARSDERLMMVDEIKLERLRNIADQHLATIKSQKARISSLESSLTEAQSLQASQTKPVPEHELEYREKIRGLSNERRNLTELLKAARKDSEQLAAENKSTKELLAESSNESKRAKAATQFVTSEFEKLKARLSSVTEESDTLKSSNTSMHQELHEAKNALIAARSEIASKDMELENLRAKLGALRVQLQDSEQANTQLRVEAQDLRYQMASTSESVRNFNLELEVTRNSLERSTNEQVDLKAELEALQKWKASVEEKISPESLNSFKLILEKMIDILDDYRKLKSPKYTETSDAIFSALDDVTRLLENLGVNYQQ